MLARLEKAHLIERRPNPQDRRGMLIVLTNERTEAVDRLTLSYSESELEYIADYFRRLVIVWEQGRKNLDNIIKRN